MSQLPEGDLWSLLDWRRRVFACYARIRASHDPEQAWREWRRERDDLFATHPQSPVSADARGELRLHYFDYDPELRILATLREARPEEFGIPTSEKGAMSFTLFATAVFALGDTECSLGVYWLAGYAGGVFVPFRDHTSGRESYAACRYLLDTIKGADLGMERGRLVLDLNFAYNPSCSYDPRWVCPLAPPANRLEVAVRAGERTPIRDNP
jgi:uncharacterized protein (DUF1684 family)